MNKRQRPSRRKKGATAAAVICFVAAIAIVGTYTFRDYKNTQKELQLAEAEETKKTEEKKVKEPSKEANNNLVINTPDPNKTNNASDTQTLTPAPKAVQDTQETAGTGSSVYFSEDSQLLWPVNGNILMNYSMDKTMYFSTLDQYKYNPALVISGAEGDQVISAAPGIIKSIDVTAETGNTVNVDLGNGYELFYGQLKEVPVKVGDYVEAKTILGYVSQPTKYYSVEGCNVYFEMRKDGQPVNPLDYVAE